MEVHVVYGTPLAPSSALFTNFRSNTGKVRFSSRCHTHVDTARLTASETPLANHRLTIHCHTAFLSSPSDAKTSAQTQC